MPLPFSGWGRGGWRGSGSWNSLNEQVLIDNGGWGQGGWGANGWNVGEVIPGATGSVGSTSISIAKQQAVTGVAGTGAVGGVTVNLTANIPVTGITSTGSSGSVSTSISVNPNATGVSGTGELALQPLQGRQTLLLRVF